MALQGDLELLQGRWRGISREENGVQELLSPGTAVTVRGQEWIVEGIEPRLGLMHLSVDPVRRRLALFSPGLAHRLICPYRLEGRRLLLCVDEQEPAAGQPSGVASFTTWPGSGFAVWVMEREATGPPSTGGHPNRS